MIGGSDDVGRNYGGSMLVQASGSGIGAGKPDSSDEARRLKSKRSTVLIGSIITLLDGRLPKLEMA